MLVGFAWRRAFEGWLASGGSVDTRTGGDREEDDGEEDHTEVRPEEAEGGEAHEGEGCPERHRQEERRSPVALRLCGPF